MAYNLSTKIGAGDTKRELYACFDRWPNAELISINELRDGSSSAAVVFEYRGQPVRITYGLQYEYKSNLRAIYLTLDSLRLAEARGLGDILTDTVSQMLQLGAAAKQRDPYEVLGVRPDAPMEDIDDMYRIKAKRLHPDAGGSTEAMAELNAAYERVKAERGS